MVGRSGVSELPADWASDGGGTTHMLCRLFRCVDVSWRWSCSIETASGKTNTGIVIRTKVPNAATAANVNAESVRWNDEREGDWVQ
jgi:hypothetical protein